MSVNSLIPSPIRLQYDGNRPGTHYQWQQAETSVYGSQINRMSMNQSPNRSLTRCKFL